MKKKIFFIPIKLIILSSFYHQTCIAELDATLDQAENDRANLVCGSLAVSALAHTFK